MNSRAGGYGSVTPRERRDAPDAYLIADFRFSPSFACSSSFLPPWTKIALTRGARRSLALRFWGQRFACRTRNGTKALRGIAGLGLAYGAVRLLTVLAPSNLPRLNEISIDGPLDSARLPAAAGDRSTSCGSFASWKAAINRDRFVGGQDRSMSEP